MTDYIVAIISLVCIFYTVTKIVGYSIDVFVAKFVATDAKLEKTVSSLISLTALRWGSIEDNRNYTVKTNGYVIIVKKNTDNDK